MQIHLLHIKNMVCPRCISVVREQLEKLNLVVTELKLGEATVQTKDLNLSQINEILQKQGFELLLDKDKTLLEQIKLELLHYLDWMEKPTNTPLPKLSNYLASKFCSNYAQLSKLFSKSEQITIEKYFILLKIEKIKELLSYHQLTLTQIANRFQYSSVQALSNQFKKITGISVSEYKQQAHPDRHSLDKLL